MVVHNVEVFRCNSSKKGRPPQRHSFNNNKRESVIYYIAFYVIMIDITI